MPTMKIALLVAVSALVGLGRFLIPGHDLSWPGTYEAMAHIWVGVLLVFCFQAKFRVWAIISLAVITILEVVLFMLR